MKILVSFLLLSTAGLGAGPICKFTAYIQGRFTNQEGTPDRLEIRRARILVFGDPFSELTYNVQVDVLKKPYLLDRFA